MFCFLLEKEKSQLVEKKSQWVEVILLLVKKISKIK